MNVVSPSKDCRKLPDSCIKYGSQHFCFGEQLPYQTVLRTQYSWNMFEDRKVAKRPTEHWVPGYSVPGLARLKDSAIGA